MEKAATNENSPLLHRHHEDVQHMKNFMRIMRILEVSDEAAQILFHKFQIEAFLKGMLEVRAAIEAKRRLKGLNGQIPGFPQVYTMEQMFIFQSFPIGASLLRIDGILQPHAARLFQEILKYIGVEDGNALTREAEIVIAQRILSMLQRFPGLRDEAFAQLQKQTRDNPFLGGCLKAWELMRVIASVFPPSPTFAGPLSEYFMTETQDEEVPLPVHQSVISTWSAMDRTLRVGPRKFTPSLDELENYLEGQCMAADALTYDGNLEPIVYDMTTTVADAAKAVVTSLKLYSCNTFGLYKTREIQRNTNVKQVGKEPHIEHLKLDGLEYIGDVILGSRSSEERTSSSFKFLLKKRIFRYTDDVITEPTFVHFCYIQVRHDYMAGYYPTAIKLTKELAALQLVADLGPWQEDMIETEVASEVKQVIPSNQISSMSLAAWEEDILDSYKDLGTSISKDEAELRALRILLELPMGGCIFFFLRKDKDPPKLFENEYLLLMGVNKSGVRVINPDTKALLHVVDLKDIEEYAGNDSRFYISMMVAGEMFGFEFVTTEGEEICTLLDTHIADALRFVSTEDSTPQKAEVAYETVTASDSPTRGAVDESNPNPKKPLGSTLPAANDRNPAALPQSPPPAEISPKRESASQIPPSSPNSAESNPPPQQPSYPRGRLIIGPFHGSPWSSPTKPAGNGRVGVGRSGGGELLAAFNSVAPSSPAGAQKMTNSPSFSSSFVPSIPPPPSPTHHGGTSVAASSIDQETGGPPEQAQFPSEVKTSQEFQFPSEESPGPGSGDAEVEQKQKLTDQLQNRITNGNGEPAKPGISIPKSSKISPKVSPKSSPTRTPGPKSPQSNGSPGFFARPRGSPLPRSKLGLNGSTPSSDSLIAQEPQELEMSSQRSKE